MTRHTKRSKDHNRSKNAIPRLQDIPSVRWDAQAFADFTHFQRTDWLVHSTSNLESDESKKIDHIMDYVDPSDMPKIALLSSLSDVDDKPKSLMILSVKPKTDRSLQRKSTIVSRRITQVSVTPGENMRRWMTIAELSGLRRDGERDATRPDMLNDVEALHEAADFMTHKYGGGPTVYEKWRRYFMPVCDAQRLRESILRRFQIEYRVNVNDYERSLQPMAKGIRRNIRQLLHKEYAPINNRSCHEKLGELLIEKNRVDLTDHLKLLEERERQRQTELLQKGIIKQDEYDKAATSKAPQRHLIRRRRRALKERSLGVDLLTVLDHVVDNPVAPDLKELAEEITKRQAALDERQLISSEESQSLMSIPSMQEWKSSKHSHSSRHNIFIPFENASKRELDLLDAGNDSMESAVASDDKRWKEWVKSEEPSSDDTGRIHEENTTPAQAGIRKLFDRAEKILAAPCFVRRRRRIK